MIVGHYREGKISFEIMSEYGISQIFSIIQKRSNNKNGFIEKNQNGVNFD